MRSFAQEPLEMERYDKNIESVLRMTYKESLARGIFFGLVINSIVVCSFILLVYEFVFMGVCLCICMHVFCEHWYQCCNDSSQWPDSDSMTRYYPKKNWLNPWMTQLDSRFDLIQWLNSWQLKLDWFLTRVTNFVQKDIFFYNII